MEKRTSWGTYFSFDKPCCATCQFWTGQREFEHVSTPRRVRPEAGSHKCAILPFKTVGGSSCPKHPSMHKKWVNLP